MNIVHQGVVDHNVTDKNQHFTSERIIAHLENYYKLYALLFCLAVSFLLIRKIIKKSSKSHTFHSTAGTNTDLAKTNQETKTFRKLLDPQDWLHIQESLRAILQDMQECLDFSWIDQDNPDFSKANKIYSFEPIKYQLIQEFMISQGYDRPCTKKIDNWEITISYTNIILSGKRPGGEKTIVTFGAYGSWSIIQESQEKNFLVDGSRSVPLIVGNKSIELSTKMITFNDGGKKPWTSKYDGINKNNEHKNQLKSFFTRLRSAIEPDLKDLSVL